MALETNGLKAPINCLSLQMLVLADKCLLGARCKMKYQFTAIIAVKDLHPFLHRADCWMHLGITTAQLECTKSLDCKESVCLGPCKDDYRDIAVQGITCAIPVQCLVKASVVYGEEFSGVGCCVSVVNAWDSYLLTRSLWCKCGPVSCCNSRYQ